MRALKSAMPSPARRTRLLAQRHTARTQSRSSSSASRRSRGRPAARLFRSSLAEHARFHDTEAHRLPRGPRVIERHAADAREEIDSSRRETELVGVPARLEIARLDAVGVERRAEGAQRAHHPRCVRLRRADEEVEVARRTDESMSGQRVGADHDELSARVDQGVDHVEEVVVDLRSHRRSGAGRARGLRSGGSPGSVSAQRPTRRA